MSDHPDFTVGELSDLLRADADAIARSLLPSGRYELGGKEWRCTGSNSPTGTPICVHVGRGEKQGICGFWNEPIQGGDLIDLYKLIHNCGTLEAADWARKWLGVGKAPATRSNLNRRRRRELAAKKKEARTVDQAVASAKRVKAAGHIWRACVPLGAQARTYLAMRGLDPGLADDELRLHPHLSYPGGGVFPAIVGRVANKDGQGTGVWRIYLKPNGDGKAPVENAKLGLGECLGSAVRIGGVWPEIGITEGIETALACRQLVKKWTGHLIPVWASLSTAGMRSIVLPPEITVVRIFADNDPVKVRNDRIFPSAGLTAARDLATRLKAEGRAVYIESPPVGLDWLDVLNAVNKRQIGEGAPTSAQAA